MISLKPARYVRKAYIAEILPLNELLDLLTVDIITWKENDYLLWATI